MSRPCSPVKPAWSGCTTESAAQLKLEGRQIATPATTVSSNSVSNWSAKVIGGKLMSNAKGMSNPVCDKTRTYGVARSLYREKPANDRCTDADV